MNQTAGVTNNVRCSSGKGPKVNKVAKVLISVHSRSMNLYVERKADKADKVKSCVACNCERDTNVGVFDCKVLWEPCRARYKH